MHRRNIPLVLAALLASACSDRPDIMSPLSPLASTHFSPTRAAEPLYHIDAIPLGTSWEAGIPDVLVEIDGRFYVPHLAVIESARENRKVAKLLERGQTCWLGAHREAASAPWAWVPPGGVWDETSYTNWSKNQPRDHTDDEPQPLGTVLALQADGTWRAVADGTVTCRIIEFRPLPEE
jgi:hypothetical protein